MTTDHEALRALAHQAHAAACDVASAIVEQVQARRPEIAHAATQAVANGYRLELRVGITDGRLDLVAIGDYSDARLIGAIAPGARPSTN